jgi:hypothetical protein
MANEFAGTEIRGILHCTFELEPVLAPLLTITHAIDCGAEIYRRHFQRLAARLPTSNHCSKPGKLS